MAFGTEEGQFDVVINDEEQYSIWPSRLPIPPGWHAVGFQGTHADCVEYVDRTWTDMRPKSLRVHMESGSDNDGEGQSVH